MRSPRNLFVAAVFALTSSACDSDDKAADLPPVPPLPEGVSEHQIDDPLTYWKDNGFTVMTPAVPLPVKKGENSRVNVWVKVPEGKTIDVKDGPSGPILVWPPGAEADRVEGLKHKGKGFWRPGDVRGSQMLEGGDQMHRVYRPLKGWSGPMFGYRWKRSKLEHEQAVHDVIDARFRRGEGQLHPVKGEQLDKRIAVTMERGKCVACHKLEKPEDTKIAVPARMTDAAGWFQPMAVLKSTVPLERYRNRMMAALNPHVSFTCPDGKAPDRTEKKDGVLRLGCRDDHLVTAAIDIKAGLAAGDAHSKAVCASRQFLFEHMTAAARDAFKAAFSECGIAAASSSPSSPSSDQGTP
jgi:hypothetical protein